MADRRTEIQVGFALVVALVVLVFGLSWFQEYSVGSRYQRVEVRFDRVGGLGAGDPVAVRGIAMGKVASVRLVDDGVRVQLRLLEAVELREDARIELGSAGIMGERMVAVEPGSGPAVDVGTTVFEGIYQAASTELVGQFDEFNDQVMAFLTRADSVLVQMQSDRLLRRTLESTARVAEVATDVLVENRAEIGRASEAMAALSERLSRFLAEHESDLSAGARGLVRATDGLDSLTVRLDSVLSSTQDVLDALKEQRGAAGRMIYDEAAGEDLVESLKKLRFLVDDLQRNPQRYLTVKIF